MHLHLGDAVQVCGLAIFLLLFVGLRKKNIAPSHGNTLEEHLKGPGQTDLFGTADAMVTVLRCFRLVYLYFLS